MGNHILKILVSFLIIFVSCKKLTDQESYQQVLKIKDPQQQITALKKFMNDFPESKNINRVYMSVFRAEVTLGDAEAAVKAAWAYLSLVPENARMLDYNRISYALADKGLALDSARVFAERAVQMGRQTNYSRLSQILDTYAYTLFKSGDAATAEKIQQEAIIGHENESDYLNSLAQYQYANNKNQLALDNMAMAILRGAEPQALTIFNDWLSKEKPGAGSQKSQAKEIVEKAITNFLEENNTPVSRSQAAMLLAWSGVDLEKAEKWASEAIDSLDIKASPDEQIVLYNNLATVYKAKNDHAKVLAVLEPWQEIALPYDLAYWTNLAQAYQQTGQKEKSWHAVMNGLVIGEDENLMQVARSLGYTEVEIKTGIEKYKAELLSFSPTHNPAAEIPTNQVILTELFTGAECPPCVGADMALDLLAEYYPRQAVAVLEYHLHIPGPDPLTNSSTEARYESYGRNFGTPTVYFNGLTQYAGGGPELVKKNLFNRYKMAVEKYFTSTPTLSLVLSIEQKNDRFQVKTEIKKTDPKETGAITLYIALVERSVRYTGGNGISRHAFVVRYLVNAGDGIPVKLKNGKSTVDAEIDLSEVNKGLTRYLENFAQNPPERYKNFPGWNVRPEKLDEKNLAVVAWLQNETSREVYQAHYAEVGK